MKSLTIFFIIFAASILLIPPIQYIDATPNPNPAKWPKKSGANKVELGVYIDPNLDLKICTGATELVKKAIEEWSSGTNRDPNDDWPAAGEHNKKSGKTNPKNSASSGGELMEGAGPKKAKDALNGKADRSYTKGEKDALNKKYQNDGGLEAKPVNKENQADIIVKPVSKLLQSKGVGDFGTGKETTGIDKKTKTKKLTSIISIRENPKLYNDLDKGKGEKEYKWFCVKDTNGDGIITNEDEKPPKGSYDFYTTIKHELGHAFSLEHPLPSKTSGHEYEIPPKQTIEKIMKNTFSPYQDISPTQEHSYDFPQENELYFSSNRPDGFGGYDIWITYLNNQTWSEPINLGPEVNTQFDEIDPEIFADYLLFSSNRPDGFGGYDLYLSTRNLSEWNKPNLLEINSESNEYGPTVSWQNNFLYFSSNRPDGFGGYDIWESEWNEKTKNWNSSQNIDEINSKFNENSPDISTNNFLYFSSNRPDGFGGYDIWESSIQEKIFLKPTNLGKQINSKFDEQHPEISFNLDMIFFSKQIEEQPEIYFANIVSNQIPLWIKTNAGWWSQNIINDNEFGLGIGYMVKEKIIVIPKLELSNTGEFSIDENLSIPSWIKTNAGWWSEGLISDDDFIKGIQFMIENGIIAV